MCPDNTGVCLVHKYTCWQIFLENIIVTAIIFFVTCNINFSLRTDIETDGRTSAYPNECLGHKNEQIWINFTVFRHSYTYASFISTWCAAIFHGASFPLFLLIRFTFTFVIYFILLKRSSEKSLSWHEDLNNILRHYT
jgi:hypothetical protein